MSCRICDMMDAEKFVIYQDKFAIALLAPQPAAEGHIIVATRNHAPILESVPDEVLSHLFIIANRISTSVFELLKARGTNITVNNGIPAGQEIPHFHINIIPRRENDPLDFKWQPLQMTHEEMEQIAAKVKDKCDYIGHEAPKPTPVVLDNKEIKPESEEDYRMKQLERMP